jgi:hypothetical protein
MKRRQKPVILITVLVLCAGLVFIMSSAQSQKPGETPPPPNSAAPETGKDVPKQSKESIATQVQQSMGPTRGQRPKGPGRNLPPGMPGAPPATPSIMNEKIPTYTPQPSDTQVQGGWFSNEAPPSYAPPKKKS